MSRESSRRFWTSTKYAGRLVLVCVSATAYRETRCTGSIQTWAFPTSEKNMNRHGRTRSGGERSRFCILYTIVSRQFLLVVVKIVVVFPSEMSDTELLFFPVIWFAKVDRKQRGRGCDHRGISVAIWQTIAVHKVVKYKASYQPSSPSSPCINLSRSRTNEDLNNGYFLNKRAVTSFSLKLVETKLNQTAIRLILFLIEMIWEWNLVWLKVYKCWGRVVQISRYIFKLTIPWKVSVDHSLSTSRPFPDIKSDLFGHLNRLMSLSPQTARFSSLPYRKPKVAGVIYCKQRHEKLWPVCCVATWGHVRVPLCGCVGLAVWMLMPWYILRLLWQSE